LSTFTNHV